MTTVDRALIVVGIAIVCLTVITITVVRRDWRPMVRIRRLEAGWRDMGAAVRRMEIATSALLAELERRPSPQWRPPPPRQMPPPQDVTAVLPKTAPAPVPRVRVDMEAS